MLMKIFDHASPIVPHLSTMGLYLCTVNLKTEVNMWFAVIVFVSLATEVLSYLTGGDTRNGLKASERKETSPETV